MEFYRCRFNVKSALKHLLIVILFLVLPTSSGKACVCSGNGWTTASAYQASDVVVYGTVTTIAFVSLAQTMDSVLLTTYLNTYAMDSLRLDMLFEPIILKAELLVKTSFKGVDSTASMTIFSPLQSSACGFLFAPGNDYIIYDTSPAFIYQFVGLTPALRAKHTYWTNNCTYTSRYDENALLELQSVHNAEKIQNR